MKKHLSTYHDLGDGRLDIPLPLRDDLFLAITPLPAQTRPFRARARPSRRIPRSRGPASGRGRHHVPQMPLRLRPRRPDRLRTLVDLSAPPGCPGLAITHVRAVRVVVVGQTVLLISCAVLRVRCYCRLLHPLSVPLSPPLGVSAIFAVVSILHPFTASGRLSPRIWSICNRPHFSRE